MSAEPLDRNTRDPGATMADDEAVDGGRRAFKDALAAAEKRLTVTVRTVDDAQRYVVERVKERPVTAALAGLGLGFLLGVLLSSRGK